MGWLCHYAGIVWELFQKWTHMQLIRENSAKVLSTRWATVDWSWPKEWNSCPRVIFLGKNKNKMRRRGIARPTSPEILACDETATITVNDSWGFYCMGFYSHVYCDGNGPGTERRVWWRRHLPLKDPTVVNAAHSWPLRDEIVIWILHKGTSTSTTTRTCC